MTCGPCRGHTKAQNSPIDKNKKQQQSTEANITSRLVVMETRDPVSQTHIIDPRLAHHQIPNGDDHLGPGVMVSCAVEDQVEAANWRTL